MFIRIKKIKGQKYAYLVKNTWTREGARQKVGKYLGKVIKPDKKQNKVLKEHFNIENIPEYVSKTELNTILKDLVLLELINHELPSGLFDPGTLTFAEQNRQIVLELNQGFLCQDTLKRVLDYKSEGDEGFKLAELLLAAGLTMEKELFVELFEKLRPKTAPSKVEGFYY